MSVGNVRFESDKFSNLAGAFSAFIAGNSAELNRAGVEIERTDEITAEDKGTVEDSDENGILITVLFR